MLSVSTVIQPVLQGATINTAPNKNRKTKKETVKVDEEDAVFPPGLLLLPAVEIRKQPEETACR